MNNTKQFVCLTLWCLLINISGFILSDFYLLKPKIATVDMTGMIHEFVKQESLKDISSAQHQDHVRAFGQQLEVVLKNISQKKHVILLLQEAVIAGGKDITPEVAAELSLENPDASP